MKASKAILRKALFNIIGGCSFAALSACAPPVTETPTTTVPPVVETPVTTVPPTTPTPNDVTADRNIAEQLQLLATQRQLQTFVKALQTTGLNERLATPGPYTVFVPNDAAFAALPKTTVDNLLQPENRAKLEQLLSYHIIPGRFTANQLKSGQVKTLEGNAVKINVDPTANTVTVNDAGVIQPDIPASNGIIHVVDKVILPANFQASQKPNRTRQ
ncbi:MAG: fasciclin domain-containing protein [Goleter apudmare HA4340-LM2]|jgi:uncharacterized surface protein with fasciclin (FAS1) repeats|nr:fasciclin domain-containing protein [Goleter apudmare HA4340-LM2]